MRTPQFSTSGNIEHGSSSFMECIVKMACSTEQRSVFICIICQLFGPMIRIPEEAIDTIKGRDHLTEPRSAIEDVGTALVHNTETARVYLSLPFE